MKITEIVSKRTLFHESPERATKLRAALNDSQCTNLLGEVSREKSMLL